MLSTFFMMGGYSFYIWTAYGLSFMLLLFIFFRYYFQLFQIEKKLKELQKPE
jgi:heme exporter protein CcmD